MELKIGHRVRGRYINSSGIEITYEGVVHDVYTGTNGYPQATIKRDDGKCGGGKHIPGYGGGWCICEDINKVWRSTGYNGEPLEIISTEKPKELLNINDLKAGDRVRSYLSDDPYIGTVDSIYKDKYGFIKANIKRDDGKNGEGEYIACYGKGWLSTRISYGIWTVSGERGTLHLISNSKSTESITTNQKTNNMGLLSKMAELVAKEPWKTFKKLGITNGDDLLTNEGRELYIQWKFKQDAEKFAEEVATPMLEAQEKENSKK